MIFFPVMNISLRVSFNTFVFPQKRHFPCRKNILQPPFASMSQTDLTTCTDEALMLAFRDTLDEDFFTELMNRHYGAALHVAQTRLFDSENATDAVQEAFVRIVRKRKKYNGRRFAPWFYAILRNICTDIIRKEMRRKKKHEDFQAEATEAVPPTPLDEFDALVAALPPRDREALTLRYAADLSFAEIAAHLDCTEAAAKKRVQRALSKLRTSHVPKKEDEA
jgi:RNA polymerase sigma factor (sigma-70 family)